MGKKFAFDWGGSLEVNGSLRQIARGLFAKGYEVHLIPACGEHPKDEVYASWMGMIGVPFTGIHRCVVKEGDIDFNTGLKVQKMKELGCHIIYDDNLDNIAAVRAAGMEAVQIIGNEPVPVPVELLEVC